MIPDEWRVVRFAEIADYKAGRTPARANPEYWDGAGDGVPWVAISDMTEFGTVTATKEKISRAAFEQVFKSQAVRAGTLIMSFKLTIGRVARLGVDACHNEAIISIYPKPGVDQRYLGYFLAQVDYDALQDRQVKGNTLNQEKIDRIEVWLPPLDEQSSIANVLDLLRQSIDLQDRALATTEDLKRSAMRELFTRGLRGEPQKETEIGLVPESWEITTLGSLCNQNGGCIQTGPFGSQLHAHEYQTEGVPVINPTHLEGNRINHADVPRVGAETACRLDRHKVMRGDILFGRRGEIGRHGLVSQAEEGWLCGTGCFLVRVRHESVDNVFLSYLFSTESLVAWLIAHAAGTIMPNLNNVILSCLPVAIPSLNEQRDIVAILDAIDRKIDLHRKRRAVLEELFKALLHKLMTGEIRVADLDLSALGAADVASNVAEAGV